MHIGPGPLDDLYSARQKFVRDKYHSGDLPADAKTMAGRNKIIDDLLLLIDQRYYRYEYVRVTAKNWGKFGGSVVNIGLSTAGTLSGVESTKTLLSAVVTAIEGSGAALDRDVLMGQTMVALAAEMRRARAARLLIIQKGMQQSVAAYPLNAALVDLLNYYYAGTYITALQSLTESAAAGAKKADDDAQAERLKKVTAGVPDA